MVLLQKSVITPDLTEIIRILVKLNIIKSIILLTCSLYFYGCLGDLKGHFGASETIENSQRRNVFVKQYYVHENFLYLLNYQMTVKEAWLENRWEYANDQGDEIVKVECYQLIVNLQEEVLDYPFKFAIGIDGDKYFRPCAKAAIMTDFKVLPEVDSIEWFVQKKYHLSESQPHEIIGKAILYTYPSTEECIMY